MLEDATLCYGASLELLHYSSTPPGNLINRGVTMQGDRNKRKREKEGKSKKLCLCLMDTALMSVGMGKREDMFVVRR